MQPQEKIITCYNATAESYAATRLDELSKKHFDRLILNEFARLHKNAGTCADFGCGPGQTTKFLFDAGLEDIVGIDISPGMVNVARGIFPYLRFETGDLLGLPYPADHFASAVAFYAIVHFDYDQIAEAFREVNRVLKKGAHFLFSFHVGEETVHFDKANDIDVDIDLHFLQTDRILNLLRDSHFRIIDAVERLPYPDAEYATRRAYVWAEKI
ncbi:class I SAM-dependent methyltransferase [Chryseolinea soli]|uniref:Class I SAM-dependent methyltransferase n=1 Tax=Chryseolinea soli TaxID=2321403 RepID=A0A385SV25_9BACT|nr:class I SAM-dependent methyltransferase [Chryseolinea soli]AYB33560.1 class I SAM-dependent methyltransferase [Chryseolinea soli]